ncbi:MAG: LysR family transcriptional regulator [Pseudomonadota bacterium]
MDLTQIRYFLAVAETLNFTTAANACAVSQPALSKAIRKLEDTLGAELFDRSGKQVRLTEFGHSMRVHFEVIEENRRKALEAARAIASTQTERLNVGIMCTIGPNRFAGFLQRFRMDNPLVELTLHDVAPDVIPELMLSGALDCVFCARSAQHDPRFEAVKLFSEGFVVAFDSGHRFKMMNSVTLADVTEEAYLDRLHCEIRDDFFTFTRSRGLELNVAVRSEREDWILEMIQTGLGVCILPESSPMLNAVDHRPLSDLPNRRELELVSLKTGVLAPALSAFRTAALDASWT